MADFSIAFERTSVNEGGWKTDDPNDNGGETYRGVARNYHPNWLGWPMIDARKGDAGFPDVLLEHASLNELVEEFYFEEYWARSRCAEMPQAIANEVFDKAVLMGCGKSGKLLQQALNVLNRNEKDYPDIDEDGHVGPMTLRVLRLCVGMGREESLMKALVLFQGYHIISVMLRNPAKEIYAAGWLNRVSIEVS